MRRAFIATQAPIPDTIPDFWRMIWEQESATVVMLSNETESGKVKFPVVSCFDKLRKAIDILLRELFLNRIKIMRNHDQMPLQTPRLIH